MSNSLKFTLKQLLDLGIICSHKRKKRREPTRELNYGGGERSSPSQSRFIPGQGQSRFIPGQGQSRFIPGQGQSFPQQSNQFADPFDPNRYTYAVRLREEKDRKLIRKLQEKQQQQDFQSAVRENFRRLDIGGENEVIRRNKIGIAENEEDIYGDIGYEREDMNGYFGRTATDDEFKSQQVGSAERFPGVGRFAVGGGFAEGEDSGYFSTSEDLGIAPEEMQQEEGFELETAAKEGGFDPETVAKEGGFDPEQPQISEAVRSVRRKAADYRTLYEDIAGQQADPYVLKYKSANEIKPEIIKILLREYREAGGENREVLRSKNIDKIRDEISKMYTGKK